MSTKNWTVLLLLALLAVSASHRPAASDQENLPCKEPSVPPQGNVGVVMHPAEKSPIMTGSPPPDELLVTRENWERSHDKLRWAMQHWRELYPTQAVTRGMAPIAVLDREPRDLMQLKLPQFDGSEKTVEELAVYLDVDAIIVMHKGKILSEHYFRGMIPSTPHALQSINKSIVATVIATLLADESLSETATIEKYVPELEDTPYQGATVRQILDMLSAVKYDYIAEDGTDNFAFAIHEKSIHPAAAFLGVPAGGHKFLLSLEAKPGVTHGQEMLYKESDPAVLVWAAERVTGRRFADLTSERLWSKLGAEFDLEAACDSRGHWTYHLSLCLRDLARWGLMLLEDGKFNGKQIVPASFISDIRENASVERLQTSQLTGDLFPEGVGYRSFFYLDTKGKNAIAAAGAFGQFCYISPDHDAVIAIFSSMEGWTSRLDEGIPFEEVAKEDIRKEAIRWQFCRDLCGLAANNAQR